MDTETNNKDYLAQNRDQPHDPEIIITRAIADILADQFVRQLESAYPSLTVRLGLSAGHEAYLSRVHQSLATYLLKDGTILSRMPPFLRLVLKRSVAYLAHYIVCHHNQPKKEATEEKDGPRRRVRFSHIPRVIGFGGNNYEEPTATISRSGSTDLRSRDNRVAFSLPFRTSLRLHATQAENILYSMIMESQSRAANASLQHQDLDHTLKLARALEESFLEVFRPLLKLQQFRDLAHDCHVSWYMATSSQLLKESFTTNIMDAGEVNEHTQSFIYITADWDPFPIILKLLEMGEDVSLAKVLTITGNSHISYAASCEYYISQTWPRIGPQFLRRLDDTIKRAWDYYYSTHLGDVDPGLEIVMKSKGDAMRHHPILWRVNLLTSLPD